ncbi:DNA-binding pseudobarrel domain-containing protein [Artemisia annua]|uniref:DNA-binding pseudobarrel domain-containing protein n=1 Tax=Artemisia annua TaxID=35608 RepID=A0A2U1KXZ6_ARTAN|nr:DNA-binding pseudobarrel domain-containing protein [Artemisia annua]
MEIFERQDNGNTYARVGEVSDDIDKPVLKEVDRMLNIAFQINNIVFDEATTYIYRYVVQNNDWLERIEFRPIFGNRHSQAIFTSQLTLPLPRAAIQMRCVPFDSLTNRLNRLPGEFVGFGKIDGVGPIMMKDLDGKEWPMVAWLDKSYKVEHYNIARGWQGFRRSNDLKECDECVFKFITIEHKIWLAKVTRKKRSPVHPPPPGRQSSINRGYHWAAAMSAWLRKCEKRR